MDQTLTCTIGGLDIGGTPSTVTWKDPDGVVVTEADDDHYELDQGVVNSEGTQSAILTIKTTKLADFVDLESFTYKCSVRSSQYTDSPPAPYQDVVANVLKLGLFRRRRLTIIRIIFILNGRP